MLLDCAPCVKQIKNLTRDIVGGLPFIPHLITITGHDNNSEVYIRNKRRVCEELNIRMSIDRIQEGDSVREVTNKILKANHDKYSHGVLLQLPLPLWLREYEKELRSMIAPEKDIDGLTLSSILAMLNNTAPNFMPCTVEGIYLLLDYYKINLKGKTVMIIGRSDLLGKPLMLLCLHLNATPIICHTYTQHISELAKQADIIISAAGCPGLVTKDFIRDDSVLVLDAGTTRAENKLYGDCDPTVAEVCTITPVPGGIGTLTTAVVAMHVAQAALQQYNRLKYK